MAFASLSFESRAVPLLRELNVSNGFMAALCGIEESKLSKALRHLKSLSNEEGLRLIATLNRLLEIRDSVRPLAMDLKNPQNTRLILDAFEGMTAEQIARQVQSLFRGES